MNTSLEKQTHILPVVHGQAKVFTTVGAGVTTIFVQKGVLESTGTWKFLVAALNLSVCAENSEIFSSASAALNHKPPLHRLFSNYCSDNTIQDHEGSLDKRTTVEDFQVSLKAADLSLRVIWVACTQILNWRTLRRDEPLAHFINCELNENCSVEVNVTFVTDPMITMASRKSSCLGAKHIAYIHTQHTHKHLHLVRHISATSCC